MPKPLKKSARKAKAPAKATRKRPTDPNRAAHALLAEHMARLDMTRPDPDPLAATTLDFDAAYKAHMAKLGAKGGKVSGARRKENLSTEQRSAIALKAARARWAMQTSRTKNRTP